MRPTTIVYSLLALLGLVTALWFGVPYWTSGGASLVDFVRLAWVNGPAATLGSDAAVLYLIANVFVLLEGRRIGMRHLWVYLLASTFLAVAVGLAAFLAMRERALASGPVR